MLDLVSICITTYNRRTLLPKVIHSILNQTYQHLEIIIVDDFSSEDISDVMISFQKKDKRIKFFKHKINRGLAAARNTALSVANGKFLAFIDDDDQWKSNYVERFVNFVKNFQEENYCFCCGTITKDVFGRIIYNIPNLNGALLDFYKMGYTPPVSAQFYYLNFLKKIGGFDENIKTGVDHDLWLNLAIHNCEIRSLAACLSIPNTRFNPRRMTCDYNKRIKGIKDSLLIWKSRIIKNIDEDFYNKFYEAYIIRENRKFVQNYILSYSYIKALVLYMNNRNSIEFRQVIKTILKSLVRLVIRLNKQSAKKTVVKQLNI